MRPHLEYAAPLWDPHLIKDITKLENVQKFAMKMCSKQWDLGYQDLIELPQLPTVQNRRLYLRLCTLYNTYGYFYFPPSVFVSKVCRHNPSLPLLYQPFAHTNAFQSSFNLHSALSQHGTTYHMMHSQHTIYNLF